MTEQDKKAFEKRLLKIWAPQGRVFTYPPDSTGVAFQLEFEQEGTRMLLHIGVGPDGSVGCTLQSCPPDIADYYYLAVRNNGTLNFPKWHREEGKGRAQTEFEEQWLPLFWRNCWLSGVLIEASAHEKAQWMQDLTSEEVQAWNLKF